MNLFVTGASGFIGGSVIARLQSAGHHIRGLVRAPGKAELLRERGIHPVLGDLDDSELLATEARRADGVINTANADHLPSLESMLDVLEGTNKLLLHTSGSSVVADDAKGTFLSDTVFNEETPFVVAPGKQARHKLNNMVLAASSRGIRTVVICPTLVYGRGQGLNPNSIQIPFLVEQAKIQGVVRLVGQGLNRWSTVHIEDLAGLYALAVEKATPGSFYFAESGEVSFLDIGAAIVARLGLPGMEFISAEQATVEWGEARALYTFGSNSRVRALRARHELGWSPRRESALAWIQHEMHL